eukprot:CAMPEP_0198422694 /NCGR_PEP_ID=MMETSP1452-20131203/2568_1 /TAXON_ID=1181717 /ORGANISM="Synchroma pusillum, Strain CCMP3072" /LENGTH=181 /DNA_ID=CAMNT_0044142969 /DNA_START=50 /DNA_END=591 /DNA_ORIENTATION=+
MSTFYRPAGLSLPPDARRDFDRIKSLADSATSDLLIQPSWDQNLQIVDAIQSTGSQDVVREAVYLCRKKLNSIRAPRVVYMTLVLVETLVKNCGERVHREVNDAGFMRTMMNVARNYWNKSGRENQQVGEKVVDLIQAWGEGFKEHKSRYPNIVDAYFTLRKEGVRFKPQYDQTTVPIFSP